MTELFEKIINSRELTLDEILDYEIKSSWWAPRVFWAWGGREIAGWWYAKKAVRKYKRYIYWKKTAKELINSLAESL